MAKTIALVEDDDTIRENYIDLLTDSGYIVHAFADRQEAQTAFDVSLPDLALLDIGLNNEREGGFDLCRYLRKISETLPVIFLTAYNTDVDEISGLRVGADDYISKDESFEKILVRINTLLRRVAAVSHAASLASQQPDHIVRQDDLSIDMANYSVTWKNRPIKLPLTQLWILHALAKMPQQLKSREVLMQAANITHSSSNTIPVHINSIRNKFREIDGNFDRIKNERGIGYKWE